MYNLEEMYVDILDTITKNVESRRDACRYTGQNNEGENKTQKQTNEMSNTDREWINKLEKGNNLVFLIRLPHSFT
jgi:hypothetical protein